MNIPNILTTVRLALVPILVVVFYLPYQWSPLLCAFIFMAASFTDWFDGYLARKWNQSTPFGAFVDPVADKIMVAVVLCLLVEKFAYPWMTLPAVVIIGREIVISALREWMAELGKRTSVAVSMVGKVKTAAQMMAICFLLYEPAPLEHWSRWIDLMIPFNDGFVMMGWVLPESFSIPALAGVAPVDNWLSQVGIGMLYLSAILTLWSMMVYLKAAWPELSPFKNAIND